MADIRFTDKDPETSPGDLDIVIGTEVSSGNDKKYTFTTIATKVKALIGNATASVAGFMSAADKTKLDLYPAGNPGNDLFLTTDSGGDTVWIAKSTATGDMEKANYASVSSTKVDTAIQSDKITASPGNDYVWTTNGGGTQGWQLQSAIADMKKSSYDAGGTGNKVDTAIISENTQKVDTHALVKWSGQTVGLGAIEIFLNGVASDRLAVTSDTAKSLQIEISALQDDGTDGAYFIRQVMIINVSGTTSLVGSVQTVGEDINPPLVAGPTISADDTNDSLKLEVNGKSGETWNWQARAVITEL